MAEREWDFAAGRLSMPVHARQAVACLTVHSHG